MSEPKLMREERLGRIRDYLNRLGPWRERLTCTTTLSEETQWLYECVAHIDALTAQLDKKDEGWHRSEKAILRVAELEAERDRLRGALMKISERGGRGQMHGSAVDVTAIREMWEMAGEALGDAGKGPVVKEE